MTNHSTFHSTTGPLWKGRVHTNSADQLHVCLSSPPHPHRQALPRQPCRRVLGRGLQCRSQHAPSAAPAARSREHGRQHQPSSVPGTSRLRLFLDTADVRAWDAWSAYGVIYGFTTNPSILLKDGVRCTLPSLKQLARQAWQAGAQELQLQAWGPTAAQQYSVGLDLAALDARVVVKLPLTGAGLEAAARLRQQGVRVTLTGVYHSSQVVTAIAAGADYAAPYLGRMADAVSDTDAALREVAAMQAMCQAVGSPLRVLVASVRSPAYLAHLAALGCDTFTVSPACAAELLNVGNTDKAAADFEKAATLMGAYD